MALAKEKWKLRSFRKPLQSVTSLSCISIVKETKQIEILLYMHFRIVEVRRSAESISTWNIGGGGGRERDTHCHPYKSSIHISHWIYNKESALNAGHIFWRDLWFVLEQKRGEVW
jgi:hypothetical protein